MYILPSPAQPVHGAGMGASGSTGERRIADAVAALNAKAVEAAVAKVMKQTLSTRVQ